MVLEERETLPERLLSCPGRTELPEAGLVAVCAPAESLENGPRVFTVRPRGQMVLRGRRSGDALRLPGGRKLLKKRMIDAKIPAPQRDRIPVLCDEGGILGVWGFGADPDRTARELPAVTVRFISLDNTEE